MNTLLQSGRNMAIELKAWRAAMGLSQQVAADKLGVPQALLAQWENGFPVRYVALVETTIGMPVGPRRIM